MSGHRSILQVLVTMAGVVWALACGDGTAEPPPDSPPLATCPDKRSLALRHDAQFGVNGIVPEWDGTPFRVDMVRNFPEFATDADLQQLLDPIGQLADKIEAQLGYRIVEMGGLIVVGSELDLQRRERGQMDPHRFPLVIGRAIDSVLADSARGLYELAILGIGHHGDRRGPPLRGQPGARATRGIYATLGEEMMEAAEGTGTSTRTARLGMLKEIVGFFENSLPELIINVLGLVGVMLVVATLSLPVFVGCLAAAIATVTLYALTGRLTIRYNEGLNDEHERQVDAIHSSDPRRLGEHLRAMMRWNIRLSDLEAANFGINWVFMIALLVFAVNAAVTETPEYGAVFALVMYVFQFMESVMLLPLFYQQWLRLREISGRLARAVGA